MAFMRLNLKFHWKTCSAGFVSCLLAACAHNTPETTSIEVSSSRVERAPVGSVGQASSPLDVNQIATANTGFESRQILLNGDDNQLSIEQLQVYADRCAPGRFQPSDGLDCSELSLRVKKVYRSEDEIQDALITLDRLGRGGNGNKGQNELDQNTGNLSHSAQGIASDLLDPSPAEQPQGPETIDRAIYHAPELD